LTGGRDPSPIPPPVAQDDLTVKPNRAGRLQRSGTVGARMFNIPSTNTIVPEVPTPQGETVAEPVRPRLQRSFTVSSTNMGEERRSAVGRRMVERLAERQGVEVEDAEEETNEQSDLPAVHRHSPAEPPAERLGPGVSFGHTEMLGVPDRPVSRETMRSNGGPFEYEMHLRRSLSSRTARGAVGVTSDTDPDSVPPSQGSDVEQLDRYDDDTSADEQECARDLVPPQAAFATPSGHVTQSSTLTNGTVHGDRSPGSDSHQSRDGLQSMTFVMGHASHGGQTPGRQGGSWPTGVEDQGSSDWGTPSRRLDGELSSVTREHHPDTVDPQTPRRTDNAQRSTLSSAVVSDDENRISICVNRACLGQRSADRQTSRYPLMPNITKSPVASLPNSVALSRQLFAGEVNPATRGILRAPTLSARSLRKSSRPLVVVDHSRPPRLKGWAIPK
jgi:hypothetical protein